MIATLWALPGSILGGVLGLLSGASMAAAVEGELHLIAPTGPAGWFFRTFGFRAITLGEVVLYRDPWDYQALRRHELRHVKQWRILGPLFPVVYGAASLWALLTGGHGYRDNALEIDARKHAGP